MHAKSQAKRIVSDDGLNIYYWVNWKANQKDDFLSMHPGSSILAPLSNKTAIIKR